MADDIEPLEYEDEREAKEARAEWFVARTALSEISYPEALQLALRHATAARPGAPANPNWVPVGPRNIGGRVLSIVQDPKNHLIYYVGTAHGGLWRTRDGGDSWQPLGQAEHAVPVGTIAVDSQDSNTVYIGTGSRLDRQVGGIGLFRVDVSVEPPVFHSMVGIDRADVAPGDAGVTPGSAHRYPRLRVDPEVRGRFWAASQTGLWRFEPTTNRFVRDFPPAAGGPEGIPPLLTGDDLPPGARWPNYATDVLVAPDPRSAELTNDGLHRYLLLFVALGQQQHRSVRHNGGVFRGRFDRQDLSVTWEPRLPIPDAGATAVVTARLAQCENKPQHVYAVFAQTDGFTSKVFRSSNSGGDWREGATSIRIASNATNAATQADYNSILEVNPDNPDIVVCGAVALFMSRDRGDTWAEILDWTRYDDGDYAQHADQHIAIFDRSDRRRLWVGNDGGLSMSRDLKQPAFAPRYWRKRSHGILAAQFQDVTCSTQPGFSFMAGGGLQDNGSWVGFGGPTWYHVGGGDGGMLALHSTNSRQVITTSTNGSIDVATVVTPATGFFYMNPVVNDIPTALFNTMRVSGSGYTIPPPSNVAPPFVGLIEQDPMTPGQLLVGWIDDGGGTSLAYWTAAPSAAGSAPAGATALAGAPGVVSSEETSTLAFSQPYILATGGAAQADAWLGTTLGSLFVAVNAAPATPFVRPTGALPFPGGLAHFITRIAVHPADPRIVVVAAVPQASFVFVSIVVGGAVGAATFAFSVDSAPAGPAQATAAQVLLAGRPFIASFSGAYNAGDQWTIFPNGTVRAVTGNSALTVELVSSKLIDVEITTPGAVGTAQFTFKIGALPVSAARATQAEVSIPGTLMTLHFPSTGPYALNDRWAIGFGNRVVARVGNTSPLIVAETRQGVSLFITYDRGATWSDVTRPPMPRPDPDIQALPPCTIGALRFSPTSSQQLFAGTLVGVFTQQNLPFPQAIAIASNPVAVGLNIPAGQTRRLSANVTLMGGAAAGDWALAVDWSSNNPLVTIDNTGLVTVAPGTAAGVVSIEARRGSVTANVNINVTAPGAAPAPPAPVGPPTAPVAVSWRPFNQGLPLTLVTDIDVIAGTNTLRIATFGRGIWDCNLTPPAPAVATPLSIRQWVIDHGRTPRQLPPGVNDDPRLVPGPGANSVQLDLTHAFDIRVDGFPFTFFDDQLDGVEFDEEAGADTLTAGEPNAVYVQVHNRGNAVVRDVDVHLFSRVIAGSAIAPYTSPAPAVVGPPPPALPNVPAALDPPDFLPLGGAPVAWQRVGTRAVRAPRLEPGQPFVARFDFVAPTPAGTNEVAFVAVCTSPDDNLAAPAPASVDTLIRNERRAALRVVPLGPSPTTAAVYIRDGVEDTGGRRRTVSFPSRSPDIIVVPEQPAPPLTPDTLFRDLLDTRPQDRVRINGTNFVYVRVHNRRRANVLAEVQLWLVRFDPDNTPHITQPWTAVTLPGGPPPPIQVTVPARRWALTPAVPLPNPPDPTPSDPQYKLCLLVALVRSADGTDPFPDVARVTDLDSFWRFVERHGDSDNVAARVFRCVT